MVEVITRYLDVNNYFAKLQAIGIDAALNDVIPGMTYSTFADDIDNPIETVHTIPDKLFPRKLEDQIGVCNTPPLMTYKGEFVRRLLLTEEQAALIPEVIEEPFFVVDWYSDEVEEIDVTDPETGEVTTETKQLPVQPYEINDYDENGVLIGTRLQLPPEIS